MIKRIFVSVGILSFMFFGLSAQDIIVTKDSRRIEAKVTEVNIDNVKYKVFAHQDGPTYTLLKSDIVTILYQNGNVETFVGAPSPMPANAGSTGITVNTGSTVNTVNTISKSQEYTKWYVGVSVGALLFDNDESIPNMIGLQGAYFFNQKYGVGLVARKCNTSFTSRIIGFSYSDEHLFLGASFFAHWGRSDAKVFFPARIGLGVDKCTSYNNWTQRNFTETLLGVHASAGIAYRVSDLISFGVNAEWASSFEEIADSEGLFGVNIGVSFHF